MMREERTCGDWEHGDACVTQIEAHHDDDRAVLHVCSVAALQVKWKSLAKSALKKKDGNMKLKKLVKQLLAEAGAGAGADADTVIEKLKKCGKFAFDGEVVRLKA